MEESPAILWPHELTPQLKKVAESIQNSSDLACAIIGAAFVDHCLGALLRRYLKTGETSNGLLKPGNALGDISRRRQMAYSLGLIDKCLADDIDSIAKVRNRFAHRFFGVSFANSDIGSFCDKLTPMGIWKGRGPKTLGISSRMRFQYAIINVSQQLLDISEKTEHRANRVT